MRWLSILEKEDVPVLICLTFADKLFAELMGANGDCDIENMKAEVQNQLNVCIYVQFHFFSAQVLKSRQILVEVTMHAPYIHDVKLTILLRGQSRTIFLRISRLRRKTLNKRGD